MLLIVGVVWPQTIPWRSKKGILFRKKAHLFLSKNAWGRGRWGTVGL